MSAEELFSENRLGNKMAFQLLMHHTVTRIQFVAPYFEKSVIQENRLYGQLQRCPALDHCTSSNPNWSGREDVNTALNFDDFDLLPWRQDPASNGFCNFLDVKFGDDFDACREDRLCFCIPSGDPNCEAEGEYSLSLFNYT